MIKKLIIVLLFIFLVYRIFFVAPDLVTPNQNIVVILIDTLRSDALPMYRVANSPIPETKTPNLMKLSSKSMLFKRAVSSSSWTAPSVASVFTGVHPRQHGVLLSLGATQRALKKSGNTSREYAIEMVNKIPSTLTTMPEYFKKHGYATYGISDNWNISDIMGFDRGFDKFISLRNKGAQSVNSEVKKMLSDWDKERPTFLYIHYIDPHSPYTGHQPWYIEDKSRSEEDDTRARYASEVEYVDQKIGELLNAYPELLKSVIFVVSDHGEQFWEYGKIGHGTTVHAEETWIPFFIYHPSFSKQIDILSPVSLVDLLPTVADLAGLPVDKNWTGRSVRRFLEDRDISGSAYTELVKPKNDSPKPLGYVSQVTVGEQIIKNQLSGENPKVYNFSINQFNGRDASKDEVSKLDNFVESLDSWEVEASERTYSESDIEHLRTLGYVN